ncbi:ABC transporter ATP-binding protein [Gracilibacillus alcaliphilus]|uniref:ABC transporter ATP-binding protein n=1 Tax=Gracilibacillus alcaliphilus TaxID=1401441 RepID=UPI0019585A89|nr:ABC transporter ATP-binding protein [Gracilibacillus alcaliphilus]MBM7676966.1 ABC-2 type transport system ATP-binding protein [Gracilibacillus alcaliphilus]
MSSIIEVTHLEKVFGDKRALQDLNFQVEQGETFGFLGPSGSGKTTTIKILTGQLRKTSGEAKVLGLPAEQLNKPEYRKRFGVVTDNSGLYQRLSIFDNLKLYAQLYDVPLNRIEEVLEMVNLRNEQKTQVVKLSKGMTQRVILARALLHKPELLFLDEPTSALDPVNSKHIHTGLKELNKLGTTIFLTTHDMSEADYLCNRVAFLHKGKVQLLDTPSQLKKQFREELIQVELRDGSQLELPLAPASAAELQGYLAADQVETIYTKEPTLGDIFVEVTGRELI